MRGVRAARVAAVLAAVFACTALGAAGQDLAATTATFARPAPLLAELGDTPMPSGLASLCQRDPSFCAPAAVSPGLLDPSAQQLALLTRVNDRVNHGIRSTTDRALYGREEFWTIPVAAGDCEDFVLLKRQLLMRAGLPGSALLITVVHDENGDGHAVLSIPTAGGDIVLDNRRDEILHWWETGYTFIKRQSEHDPRNWVSLGADRLRAAAIASGPGLP